MLDTVSKGKRESDEETSLKGMRSCRRTLGVHFQTDTLIGYRAKKRNRRLCSAHRRLDGVMAFRA